ncbi:MAG: DUF871 family protein [Tissierellales bacterium]|nr:DUF871 family protein [Tissierellales bacterium]
MSSNISFSIYVSTWRENIEALPSVYTDGASVFTSLHVPEENNEEFINEATEMIKSVKKIGYNVIADVSNKTLSNFKVTSLEELANLLPIDILRIDYGFNISEIIEIKNNVKIAINGSTINKNLLEKLNDTPEQLIAIHNFYPRVDTGLDDKQFIDLNNMLLENNFRIYTFIPGDLNLRGPVYEGLPTLESHRNCSPYACFVDMHKNYSINDIIVGDGIISHVEYDMIKYYKENNVIILPVELDENYKYLDGTIFSIREDSPYSLLRLKESREYALMGDKIYDHNCIKRIRGCLTIDNYKYGRYSGEIQITKKDYQADERVNVIGQIKDEYILLLKCIKNGDKIKIINV